MGIRIHKEILSGGQWQHWEGKTVRDVDAEQFLSVLERYCLGMVIIEEDRVYSGLTALDYKFSSKHIESVVLLRSDDICRLRKVWPEYFGDFDTQIGYFLWDCGDVVGFPPENASNKTLGFEDYRMIVWGT